MCVEKLSKALWKDIKENAGSNATYDDALLLCGNYRRVFEGWADSFHSWLMKREYTRAGLYRKTVRCILSRFFNERRLGSMSVDPTFNAPLRRWIQHYWQGDRTYLKSNVSNTFFAPLIQVISLELCRFIIHSLETQLWLMSCISPHLNTLGKCALILSLNMYSALSINE